MFSTIRARLTLSHLVVIVLAMVLSGLLLLSFVERYFLQATEDSLAAQARLIAQALIPGAMTGGPQVEANAAAYNFVEQQRLDNTEVQAQNVYVPPEGLSPDTIDLSYLTDGSVQLGTQFDTRILILDAQGVVLIDSLEEEQGNNLRDTPLVAQALAGQYGERVDRPDRAEPAVMHVAVPIQVEGVLAAVVYLSQPLRDVAAVLHDLRTLWLLPTAIVLLPAGAVGLILSRAISRPLRRLTKAAQSVAGGQLDQQVPVGSRDELGQLSEVFNEMTARLQTARQTEIDFVANVSHELRTPLTAIKGMVETLRDGAVDDAEVRDRFLETTEIETDRLIRLVNDLLLLSRADSEALDLRCEPVDLAQLVWDTAGRLAPQAEEQGIVLSVEASPGAPIVSADPDRIEQVLVNLLDNAVKYSRSGGTVLVRVEGGGGRPATVQVHDEGIGIPAEDLARIGQRFYRADKARSRAEGGSGLGLSIAQALIEAHGGELWVESQEGQGTTVSFTLPEGASP
jgi:signal transduction histidine kinase